jgi:hypothetical protein
MKWMSFAAEIPGGTVEAVLDQYRTLLSESKTPFSCLGD